MTESTEPTPPVEDPQDEANVEPSIAGESIEPHLQYGITQEPKEYDE